MLLHITAAQAHALFLCGLINATQLRNVITRITDRDYGELLALSNECM